MWSPCQNLTSYYVQVERGRLHVTCNLAYHLLQDGYARSFVPCSSLHTLRLVRHDSPLFYIRPKQALRSFYCNGTPQFAPTQTHWTSCGGLKLSRIHFKYPICVVDWPGSRRKARMFVAGGVWSYGGVRVTSRVLVKHSFGRAFVTVTRGTACTSSRRSILHQRFQVKAYNFEAASQIARPRADVDRRHCSSLASSALVTMATDRDILPEEYDKDCMGGKT